jgi:hypothetical protein
MDAGTDTERPTERTTQRPKQELGLTLFVCGALIVFVLQIVAVLSLLTGLFVLLLR